MEAGRRGAGDRWGSSAGANTPADDVEELRSRNRKLRRSLRLVSADRDRLAAEVDELKTEKAALQAKLEEGRQASGGAVLQGPAHPPTASASGRGGGGRLNEAAGGCTSIRFTDRECASRRRHARSLSDLVNVVWSSGHEST